MGVPKWMRRVGDSCLATAVVGMAMIGSVNVTTGSTLGASTVRHLPVGSQIPIAKSSSSARPASADGYSNTTFPSNLAFSRIAYSSRGLVLSGRSTLENDEGVDCLVARVNPTTLALSKVIEPRCDDPRLAGEPVVPFQEYSSTMYSRVRIGRIDPASGHIELGPVVLTYLDASDTHLEWTYGPGSLCLYASDTKEGARVLRVSDADGKVVQDTHISPAFDRPLITAGASGLYIAQSGESGLIGPSAPLANQNVTIFHLGVNATNVEALYHSTSQLAFVSWMTGDGNSLWADICVRAENSRTCDIARFNGLNPQPSLQVSDRGLTGGWVVGNLATGFFSTVESQTNSAQGPAHYRITRIDPSTGQIQVIGSVTLPEFWPGNQIYGSSDAIIADHSLYLVVPANLYSPSALYRIPLGGQG